MYIYVNSICLKWVRGKKKIILIENWYRKVVWWKIMEGGFIYLWNNLI